MSEISEPFPVSCVVDASVLGKLFLPEEGSDVATALVQDRRDDVAVVRAVPDLAYLECANIFWKWVRRGKLSAELAHANLMDLLDLPLEVWPSAHLAERALATGIERDLTVYDGAYLALADALEVPLVTADAELARKAGGPGSRVRLLDSFQPLG